MKNLKELLKWPTSGVNLAERELKLAIELNPNYDVVHQYYFELLAITGRTKEAEEQIDGGAINIEDGKNYYNGIESDDREEERMINADRANARGDDGLYDNIISGSYDTNIDIGGGNP